MYGGNPNRPTNPFATQEWWKSKVAMGADNPYGYGDERVDGALALQRNVWGLPTNTVPLPAAGSSGQGLLSPAWHARAQTNNAPSRYAVRMAGWRFDPVTQQYLHGNQVVTPEEYDANLQAARATRGQTGQVANGVRTGAVADAYAARVQPPPAPARRPLLRGY